MHLLFASFLTSFVAFYPNYLTVFLFFPLSLLIIFISIGTQKYFSEKMFRSKTEYELSLHSSVLSLLLLIVGIRFPLFLLKKTFPYKFGRWGFREKRLTVPEEGMISLIPVLLSTFSILLLLQLPSCKFLASLISLSFLFPLPPYNGKSLVEWKGWLWFLLTLSSISFAVGFF